MLWLSRSYGANSISHRLFFIPPCEHFTINCIFGLSDGQLPLHLPCLILRPLLGLSVAPVTSSGNPAPPSSSSSKSKDHFWTSLHRSFTLSFVDTPSKFYFTFRWHSIEVLLYLLLTFSPVSRVTTCHIIVTIVFPYFWTYLIVSKWPHLNFHVKIAAFQTLV